MLSNDTPARAGRPRGTEPARAIRPPADDDELLSFKRIHQEEGGPAEQTLYIWSSTNRYGFRKIVTKVGRLSRVRRWRWRKFLDDLSEGKLGDERGAAE